MTEIPFLGVLEAVCARSLGTDEAAVDSVVLHLAEPAAVMVAEAVEAHDRAGRKGSSAVVAFEGFASQPNGSRPSCYQRREAEVQGPVAVGSASAHPIAGQEDRHQERQVDKLEDVRLVAVEHHPGWAVRWLVDL